jgi:hypothetical protein
MAVVPATHSFVDGSATSSEMNTYVRDPLLFLMTPPIARLVQTVAQSITSAVATSLTFDTETVDTNVSATSQHDNVTNNSRFTAVYAGWYSCGGGSGWAANVTNRRGIRWAVNGTAINGSNALVPATGTGTCQVPARREFVYLNVGDYVEAQGFQDSGGALNTAVSTDQQSNMTVRWVSN